MQYISFKVLSLYCESFLSDRKNSLVIFTIARFISLSSQLNLIKMQSNSIGSVHWGQQVEMFLQWVRCKCEMIISLVLSCVSLPSVIYLSFQLPVFGNVLQLRDVVLLTTSTLNENLRTADNVTLLFSNQRSYNFIFAV